VQLQQSANTSDCDDAWNILEQLQEQLNQLEGPRSEIRDLGRTVTSQGAEDIEQELDVYVQEEAEILLKLAQMRLRTARQHEEVTRDQLGTDLRSTTPPPTTAMAEGVSISDSGVFSFAEREAQSTGSANERLVTSTPIKADARIPASPSRQRSASPQATAASSSMTSVPTRPPAPPGPPTRGLDSTASPTRRTYAEVARSPVRQLHPPVASTRSDTQRQLELAKDEWKERLARLDKLVQSTSKDNVDPNEIVSLRQSLARRKMGQEN